MKFRSIEGWPNVINNPRGLTAKFFTQNYALVMMAHQHIRAHSHIDTFRHQHTQITFKKIFFFDLPNFFMLKILIQMQGCRAGQEEALGWWVEAHTNTELFEHRKFSHFSLLSGFFSLAKKFYRFFFTRKFFFHFDFFFYEFSSGSRRTIIHFNFIKIFYLL